MIKKYSLPIIILILIYGFWISPEFKETAAGIALFLFGMLCLEQGFQAFTGGTLETILRNSTSRSWKSFTFGAVATTLMQSSHLVTLVSISFVSAELITLASGIGIVIGANVGSITGGWLIAGLGLKVDIAAYAMPILIFGVLFLMQKSPSYKGIGNILLGAGFLFLGIHFMKNGFEGMQESFDLSTYSMEGFAGVLVFTLIGFVMTTLVQSSHASLLSLLQPLQLGRLAMKTQLL